MHTCTSARMLFKLDHPFPLRHDVTCRTLSILSSTKAINTAPSIPRGVSHVPGDTCTLHPTSGPLPRDYLPSHQTRADTMLSLPNKRLPTSAPRPARFNTSRTCRSTWYTTSVSQRPKLLDKKSAAPSTLPLVQTAHGVPHSEVHYTGAAFSIIPLTWESILNPEYSPPIVQ